MSLDREDPSDPGSRNYYRLCQLCGWDRAGKLCPHRPQLEALRETPSEVSGVPQPDDGVSADD